MKYSSINPSTGELYAEHSYASGSVLENTISDLNAGFEAWKFISPQARSRALMLGLLELQKNKDKMCQEITCSMGKPISQSVAEFQKSVAAGQFLCELDHHFLQPEIKKYIDSSHVIYKSPLGIIFGIMPWNFPLWQAIRMLIPTLISGNAVLLKHSDLTAGVGDILAHCFSKEIIGFDVFRHLLTTHEDSEKIISDPRIGGVSLTGSIRAGKTVAEIAGRNLKRCVLELGGSDPSLVFGDCDLENTVKSVLRSRFLNAGQVCISTKRVFVERHILDLFLDRVLMNFSKFKPSRAELSSCELGPLSHTKFALEFKQQIEKIRPFSQLIAEIPLESELQNPKMAFVSPQVLLFEKHIDFFKTSEIFGPALCVIPFDSSRQGEVLALQDANSTIFGLGASVYTQDRKRAERLAQNLQAGQITINSFVSSDARLPFGGFKQSGLGRELGVDGFLEFVSSKVISNLDSAK